MNQQTILLIISFALLTCGTVPRDRSTSHYNFAVPDARYILPDTLREISGVTIIDSNALACVQDENGILFIYDPFQNEIRSQYPFNMDGDYEGICRVDKTIYILRSDGILFELENYDTDHAGFTIHDTKIPAINNEGLCYDQANERLLMACKSNISKEKEDKDKRLVYAFDLQLKKLNPKPIFIFHVDSIKQFANDLNLDLPFRNKKNGEIQEPIIKFRPSAICIHPLTNQLYLLSAVDHLLFVFDLNGKPNAIIQLDPILFNKPEGIAFFKNGDMLITNEGQDHQPTLLFLKYRTE